MDAARAGLQCELFLGHQEHTDLAVRPVIHPRVEAVHQ